MVLSFYNYIHLNFNFKVENFVWSSIHFVILKLQFESQGSEFHGYLLSPFLLFCPKVWDPICWEDIYVSFQPSFVSSVISDEPTCLAILRKIMASPIQNVTVAVAHWTKMVFYLVFAKWFCLISVLKQLYISNLLLTMKTKAITSRTALLFSE